MKARMTLAAVAVTAASLTGACGDDDDAGNRRAEVASTTGSATASIVGSYERMLTSDDIERTEAFRNEGQGQGRPEPGPLALTLTEDTLELNDLQANLTIRQDFSATADGALRIGAYQRPEQASFCGPDVSQTASYRWKRAGSTLTLEARQDECADRDSILGGEWKETR